MSNTEYAIVLFVITILVNLVAWVRYSLYGGPFTSLIIVGLGALVIGVIIMIMTCYAVISFFGLPVFGLMMACTLIPVVSALAFQLNMAKEG